jgi:hypothetical protein
LRIEVFSRLREEFDIVAIDQGMRNQITNDTLEGGLASDRRLASEWLLETVMHEYLALVPAVVIAFLNDLHQAFLLLLRKPLHLHGLFLIQLFQDLLEDLVAFRGVEYLHERHGGRDLYLFIFKDEILTRDFVVLILQGLDSLFWIKGLIVESGVISLDVANDGIIESVVQIGCHPRVATDIRHHLGLLRNRSGAWYGYHALKKIS